MTPPDRMYRFRKYHLTMLVLVFVAAVALVLYRGVTGRGLLLIIVAGALVGIRWWQFRRIPPPT